IQYDYSLTLISNMNEIYLTFDLPSATTIEEIRSCIVSIQTCNHKKASFTIVLTYMANSAKLLPMIIFKLKNISHLNFSSSVIIQTNKQDWINEKKMLY